MIRKVNLKSFPGVHCCPSLGTPRCCARGIAHPRPQSQGPGQKQHQEQPFLEKAAAKVPCSEGLLVSARVIAMGGGGAEWERERWLHPGEAGSTESGGGQCGWASFIADKSLTPTSQKSHINLQDLPGGEVRAVATGNHLFSHAPGGKWKTKHFSPCWECGEGTRGC